ncbi:MAG: hypothetical protein NVSMB32_10810 [Actinomycetota bacterium]
MSSVDRSHEEASTIATLRRADASLTFAPDVGAFAARLALEPSPALYAPGASITTRVKVGRWWLRGVLAGTTLVATLSGSAVAMAQGAQPGSGLYGIKRASESVWLATSIGPQDRASRLLGLADRRASEVIAADRAGHHLLALRAAAEARRDIRAAQELAGALPPEQRGKVDERADKEDQKVTMLVGDAGASGTGRPANGVPGAGATPADPLATSTPPSGATGPVATAPDPLATPTPPSGAPGPVATAPDPSATPTPPSGATGPAGAAPDQQAAASPLSTASAE